MKHGLAFFALALLCACGGGNSGGGGIPPTAPPTISPTVSPTPPTVFSILWTITGQLEPNGKVTTASEEKRTGIYPSDISPSPTPSPIIAMVCEPRADDCNQTDVSNLVNPTTQITEASPAPSPNPSMTPNVAIAPPSAATAMEFQSTLPLFSYNLQTSETPGTYTVSVTFPDGSMGSNTIVQLPDTVLGCLSSSETGLNGLTVYQGYSFDSNSYVSDPSQADMYMSGPDCPGNFNATYGSGDYRLNFPEGATLIGGPSPGGLAVLDLTQAMFSNPPATWNGGTVNSSVNVTQTAYGPNDIGFVNDPVCDAQFICYAIVLSRGGNYYAVTYAVNGRHQFDATHGPWLEIGYNKL